MPTFDDRARSAAPPEEVWKLLYDPTRFRDWWAGIETASAPDADGGYTMYLDGYPDFPMPQRLATHAGEAGVTISCLVSDLSFQWRLAPLEDGGTEVVVHVELPEREAQRLDDQRDVIGRSLRRLVALAGA